LPARPEPFDDDFVVRGRCGFPDALEAFFAGALAAFLAGFLEAGFLEAAFLATAFLETTFLAVGPPLFDLTLTLPTTTSEPMDGKIVDSSPPDQLTRSREPLTPVTTPSRGAWPTRFEGT
jgi:hypothetical protein